MMTISNATSIHNPYWEEVQAFPGNELARKYQHRWVPEWQSVAWRDHPTLSTRQLEQIKYRDDLVSKYAWAIPDPESLTFVSKHLGTSAVEIGAGVGYWAYCLAQLGTYVTCYDVAPPQHCTNNHWHSPRKGRYQPFSGERRDVWYRVYQGNHNKAAHYSYPLFLCWPPYEDMMAFKTLKAYQGKKLVYIGEAQGGCTGDDAFFALLASQWQLVDQHRPSQWYGIKDMIEVYVRKETKNT